MIVRTNLLFAPPSVPISADKYVELHLPTRRHAVRVCNVKKISFLKCKITSDENLPRFFDFRTRWVSFRVFCSPPHPGCRRHVGSVRGTYDFRSSPTPRLRHRVRRKNKMFISDAAVLITRSPAPYAVFGLHVNRGARVSPHYAANSHGSHVCRTSAENKNQMTFGGDV